MNNTYIGTAIVILGLLVILVLGFCCKSNHLDSKLKLLSPAMIEAIKTQNNLNVCTSKGFVSNQVDCKKVMSDHPVIFMLRLNNG